MGALLATLGFGGRASPTAVEPLQMTEEVSEEQIVLETWAHATRNLFRDKVYRSDLYKGLDQRIPVEYEGDEMEDKCFWRMNVDHPLVYVLVVEFGQQPIHITDDIYGTLVVYKEDQVEQGIDHLLTLCCKNDHEVLNDPNPL